MHGVNFDVLERRDPSLYGGLSLTELEVKIKRWARELGLEARFFQSNSEGEFVEHLHRLPELADAAIVNAGAWTHYSRAIADALELAAVPAVEVHLSDVESREDWRKLSVFDGIVLAKISGKGPDGYREALEVLAGELGTDDGLMRGRGDRLAGLVAERELDPLLVTHLVNVRYLTGFGGTNGACICGADAAALPDRLPLHRAGGAGGRGLGGRHGRRRLACRARRAPGGKVGFEDDHLSVRTHGKLAGAAGRGGRAGRRGRAGRGAAAGQGRAGAEGDRRGGAARRRGLRLDAGARPGRPQRARGGPGGGGEDPRARRRAVVSADRRRRPQRGAAARRARRARDRQRGAGRLRHGGAARRLLLGLHSHVRDRRAGREGREVYELVREAQAAGARGDRAPERTARAVDAVPRELINEAGHGRSLRPRPGPWGRAGGARGAAAWRAPRTPCRRATS